MYLSLREARLHPLSAAMSWQLGPPPEHPESRRGHFVPAWSPCCLEILSALPHPWSLIPHLIRLTCSVLPYHLVEASSALRQFGPKLLIFPGIL